MISFLHARQLIRETAQVRTLEIECVSLTSALGRVCAKERCAPLDIQPFDNAAMDGFAVRLEDLEHARPDHPATLKKSGLIPAGFQEKSHTVEAGCCLHIMTGAPVPFGTEAIVPIEDVVLQGDKVIFTALPKKGVNIRLKGQDFKKGDAVLKPGDQITPAHILPLATLGIAEITVYKKPKVLFISTGTELVDDLGSSLKSGQIYNSNLPYARAFLADCGLECVDTRTVHDDSGDFIQMIQTAKAEEYDLIVSSGAVSAGAFDFVKESLVKIGAEILYHKIKLKPGKPNLLARLPSGGLYFGLPGNPVATAVGLRFFVMTALRVMMKQPLEAPGYARMLNKFTKKSGLHMVLKGKLEYGADGTLTVDILEGQESFMVSPFLSMNCWVFANEETDVIDSGEIVEIYPLIPH